MGKKCFPIPAAAKQSKRRLPKANLRTRRISTPGSRDRFCSRIIIVKPGSEILKSATSREKSDAEIESQIPNGENPKRETTDGDTNSTNGRKSLTTDKTGWTRMRGRPQISKQPKRIDEATMERGKRGMVKYCCMTEAFNETVN